MADKQKKDKKAKKENFFKRAWRGTATYFKATKSELKKVSWPTPKQLVNNTVIVIVCIVVVGVVIFILDTIFGLGFNFLNNNKLKEPASEEPEEVVTETDGIDSGYDDLLDGVDFESATEETQVVTE